MKKIIALILVISLMFTCIAGCMNREKPSAKDRKDAVTEEKDAVTEEKDAVTEEYKAGRYLNAIKEYEKALRDPSVSITASMKAAYDDSLVQYREAAYAKAENAFGANRDYDAAIQVLRGAIEAAADYDSITEPLERKISVYVTMYYEDEMDKAFQAGDYLDAARKYEVAEDKGIKVTEHMAELYNDCFTKYLEEAYAAAEEALGENKDYDAAIHIIRRYMDGAEMLSYSVYNALENKANDYIGAKYADLMDEAYKAGNYLETARTYEEASVYDVIGTNEVLKQQYEDSVSKYLKTVSDEARNAFGSNKDYNAALTRIRASLAEANDVEAIVGQLESMLEEYMAYIPVPLLKTLQYTKKSEYLELGNSRTDTDLLKDVNGVQYDADNVLYFSDPWEVVKPDNEVYIEFNLNYQYSELTGTVYRPYSTLACEGSWNLPGGIRIYGDGQMLYESPEVTQATFDAIPFSVDVSGVRLLKIELYGRWGKSAAYGIYDYTSKACVGNLMVHK